MTLPVLGYALLGGLLPSLVWLYFILKEDARCPEPKTMIAFAFLVGMFSVFFAIPLEQIACTRLALDSTAACSLGQATWNAFGFNAMLSWALIEETLKYIVAAAFVLWRPAVDEAPDYVVYLITVALGFAMAENTLYILNYSDGSLLQGSILSDQRFLGATLLHLVSSASIGFALAFSDFKHPAIRVAAAATGLILAVSLHTAFNALIMNEGASTFTAVFFVWIVAVIIFATFEVLKYFQYRNLPTNICPS